MARELSEVLAELPIDRRERVYETARGLLGVILKQSDHTVNLKSLKTWPQYFKLVQQGVKTLEIRKNDRDFQVDDFLLLEEFDPVSGYTGESILVRVLYIIQGEWGLPADTCVMAITKPLRVLI